MRTVTVIGCLGPELTAGAAPALAEATLVAGAARHLSLVDTAAERVELGDVPGAVARIAAHPGPVAVLASGDPGFFGIVRALRAAGIAPRVLPAPSSVATAFARLGLPWDDALVVSAHGRSLRPCVNACRAHPKVAVLTGPGAGPAELGAGLGDLPRRLVVAQHLGTPQERLVETTPKEAASQAWAAPNVTLVLTRGAQPAPGSSGGEDAPRLGGVQPDLGADGQPESGHGGAGDATHVLAGELVAPAPRWLAGAAPVPAGWALPETAFRHRDAMITKAEVRALVLARLGPRTGDLVWDVGAGSGSVAVECARFGAAVVAVERDAAAVATVRANATRHRVAVEVVHGAAPECLRDLPEPDAVFLGGGGLAVLAACAGRRPVRLVATFAAVQRVGPALSMMESHGYRAGAVQLQANRLDPLPGGGHRLAATNPVFVLSGELP